MVTASQGNDAKSVGAVSQRTADIRMALLLTYITLAWMTVEGLASLALGWVSKSLLLEAFGIDSVVELFSAGVLLWRLQVEAGARLTKRRSKRWRGAPRGWLASRSIY